jgi:hypothetical protein
MAFTVYCIRPRIPPQEKVRLAPLLARFAEDCLGGVRLPAFSNDVQKMRATCLTLKLYDPLANFIVAPFSDWLVD